MKHTLHVVKVLMVGLLLVNLGCKKAEEVASEIADTVPTVPNFTATDIEKTWTSGCTVGTDPITGGNRYDVRLVLNAGSFSYTHTVYVGGSCTGLNTRNYYSSSGTYTVGSTITGGQDISFVVNSSSIMPSSPADGQTGTATQTALITDCSTTITGLSPANANKNGGSFSTYMALCQNWITPNSANKNVSNVATFSNSVLTIGLPYIGVPGTFLGHGQVPAAATLQLF